MMLKSLFSFCRWKYVKDNLALCNVPQRMVRGPLKRVERKTEEHIPVFDIVTELMYGHLHIVLAITLHRI